MKILITGGAGFIASHIADACIAEGHEIFIIDDLSTGVSSNIPSKANFFNLNINSSEVNYIFEAEQFDVVIHHAAQINVRTSVSAPLIDAAINIFGGINIYEAARKYGVKKIIFSSTGGAIYGDNVIHPTPENSELEPCSPYGIAKLANEKYLRFYKDTYGVDFVCLRYANVYGPRQNPKGEAGVVSVFINKMLNDEQPIINGTGEYIRDYVNVRDVVKANLFALRKEVSGIYNVGTEVKTTTNQIFTMLNSIIGKNVKEVHGPAMPGEQLVSCISHQKFLKEHGWKPDVKLIDGLKETVDYFKNAQ
ncbi:MAG: NAD-dependent epimerase/dehydratase family protein [Ignavibacteria bacterium]|jgi:UDP-glucose 4-epimerase|nr:NAD-dependent epimerase/dehydratase family protein [Ignavibacteria bacterium]